jgi:AcrR family transcriptional regulator
MSVIRHRSDEDKAKVRTAMLEAAGELLVKEGYDGVTLAKVGKKVGFTTTNVYRYFENKDELIYAAIEDAFIIFGERLEYAKQTTPDPFARIFRLGEAYVRFAEEYPVAYYLMFVDETDWGKREIPGVDKLRYIVEALEEAMQIGQIRRGNPHTLGDVLWGLLHGIITLAKTMPFIDRKRKEAALAEAFELMKCQLKAS